LTKGAKNETGNATVIATGTSFGRLNSTPEKCGTANQSQRILPLLRKRTQNFQASEITVAD